MSEAKSEAMKSGAKRESSGASEASEASEAKIPGKDGRPIGVGDKVKRWCPLYGDFKAGRVLTEIDGDRVHLHYLGGADDGWYIASYEVQLDD